MRDHFLGRSVVARCLLSGRDAGDASTVGERELPVDGEKRRKRLLGGRIWDALWRGRQRRLQKNRFENRRFSRAGFAGLAGEVSLEPRVMLTGDNQISEAIALSVGTPRNDTLTATDDVDMFKFVVQDGQTVRIDVDATNSSAMDTILLLFDINGNTLAFNDDGGVSPDAGDASNLSPEITHTFSQGGTYFVGVSVFGNNSYNPIDGTGRGNGSTVGLADGVYSIEVTSVGAPASDPNDQISEGVSLGAVSSAETSVFGRIDLSGDVDMFSFTATAGQRVAIELDDVANQVGLDGYLRLFNSDGHQLDADDDGAAPGETPDSDPYLEFTFATAGTYFVGVSQFANRVYDPTSGSGDGASTLGDYELTLQTITLVSDVDDAGSESDASDSLRDGVALGGAIDIPEDADVWRFSGTAGRRYTIDIDQVGGGSFDSYIRLFAADGQEVAFDDNGSAPGEGASEALTSYLDFSATVTTTYYVLVSGYGNNDANVLTGDGDAPGATGLYTITWTDFGAGSAISDPGDQISEAQSLGTLLSPVGVQGAIGQLGEVDMYSIDVVAGQRVSFDIDPYRRDILDSYVRLFNSDGIEIGFSDNGLAPGEPNSHFGNSYFEHTFLTGGTYYVGVSAYGNTSYSSTVGTLDEPGELGAYQLLLRSVSPNTNRDLDDQFSEAIQVGAINGPTSFTGEITTGRDVDMYAFTVSAGQRVRFDIDNYRRSNVDTLLRLFNWPSGTVREFNDNGLAAGESASTALNSYFEHTFPVGGTYFLGVSGAGNDNYNGVTGAGDRIGTLGSYRLTFSTGTNANPDADDTIAEAIDLGTIANTVGAARSVVGEISEKDVDIYKFTVAAGQRVSFDIDNFRRSNFDGYLRLLNVSGSNRQVSDNALASGEVIATHLNSYLEHTFPVGGTYYIAVSGAGNTTSDALTGGGDVRGTLGAYRLTVTTAFLGNPDPDDRDTEAIELGVLSERISFVSELSDPTDIDLYAIEVTAGQRVSFDIDNFRRSNLDSYLRIFDPFTLRQVAFSNDGLAPGEPASTGLNSYLEYTFKSTGTYYVGVSGYGNNSYSIFNDLGDEAGAMGNYRLTIDLLPPTANPDPDDQRIEATALGAITGAVTSVAGEVSAVDDVDMYSFTVTAGQRVGFDIDPFRRSSLDGFLRVFDGTGAELVFADFGDAPDDPPRPLNSVANGYVEYTFATAGTYFIGVGASGNAFYNPNGGGGDLQSETLFGVIGSYRLNAKLVPNTSNVDPDDTIGEARELLLPAGIVNDEINTATDVDMYQVTVNAGQQVTFAVSDFRSTLPGYQLDSYLRLFNAAGQELASNDLGDGGVNPLNSRLSFTFPVAGTFYVGVSGAYNTSYDAVTGGNDSSGQTGFYTLSVFSSSDADVNDDRFQSTTLGFVGLSTTVTRVGQIHIAEDVDMYRIIVGDDQRVSVDIDNFRSSSALDTLVRVFDSSGSMIAVSDNGLGPGDPASTALNSYLETTLLTAGIYYIGVSGFGNGNYDASDGSGDTAGATGNYRLTVQGLPTPSEAASDPDDQIGEVFSGPNNLGSITTARTVDGELTNASDVDLYAFTVTAGQTVDFSVVNNRQSYDDVPYLQVYDALGAVVSGSFAPFSFTFAVAGTYYVGVIPSGSGIPNVNTGAGASSVIHGGYRLTVAPGVTPSLPSGFGDGLLARAAVDEFAALLGDADDELDELLW